MQRVAICNLLAFSLLLSFGAGCGRYGYKRASYRPPTTETQSAFYDVPFASFLIDPVIQPPLIRYGLTLQVKKSQGRLLYLTVEYEDLRQQGRQLLQQVTIEPDQTLFQLESKPIAGMHLGRHYWVTITTFADPGRSTKLDRFTQRIRSHVDWSVMHEQGMYR